jgi:drug/metabolite transporter (DMT)-like permease
MTANPLSKIAFLFIMIIFLWGLNWPMNKIGMEYMSALWHAALRLGIGCVSMFVLVGLLGKLKTPKKNDLPLVFIMGLLQMGLFTLLINLGLNFVDAGRSAILVYTIPIWVTPMALFFFNEKLNVLKSCGLALGFFGIMILFSPFSLDWTSNETIYGNCILIGAALSMAISICCARNLKWHSTPLELLPWQLLVGTLPVLLIAFINEPSPTIEWNSTSILAMTYTAVLATALCNGGIAVVSRRLPSITVSLGLLGVPLVGVISAALILDEDITKTMKLAMIFIFSGLFCVALSARNKKENPLNRKLSTLTVD